MSGWYRALLEKQSSVSIDAAASDGYQIGDEPIGLEMKSMMKSNRLWIGCWVLGFACANDGLFHYGYAQGPKPGPAITAANTADPSLLAAVTISDEPRYIDPIALVPEVLRAKVTHTFQEVPLNEVAAWIQTETGLNVVLDERALDEQGVLPSEPLSESLTNVPLYQFLDRLERIGVDWSFDAGLVTLQPPQASLRNVQYNIGDLLDLGFKPETLISALTSTVESNSWVESGGVCTAVLLGDVLFVRQVPRTHRRVVAFLEALRHPSRRTWIDEPKEHAIVVSTLETEASVLFKGTSLSQAIQSLADQYKLNIRLDRVALRKARISERLPISIDIRKQSIRTILQVLTTQHHLAWFYRDGVLWVTTQEEAAGKAKIAVFDVRDLCRNMSDCRKLQNAIEQQSKPDSWQSAGGTSVISFPTSGIMVVTQTEPIMDEVLNLLENYRSALKNSKRRISQDVDPEGYETKYYRLPTVIAVDLQSVLPELVAKESWSDTGIEGALGTIQICRSKSELRNGPDKAAPPALESFSVLIIHQKRRIHTEILDVIRKIEEGNTQPVVQMGAGMGGMGGVGMGGMF